MKHPAHHRRPIGLVGLARAGKDTTALRLASYGYERVAFADVLKRAALAVDPIVEVEAPLYSRVFLRRLSEVVEEHGWEGAKMIPEVRRFLQQFGVTIRDIDPDFWVNAIRPEADRILAAGLAPVFTDVRFENEVDLVNEYMGAIVLVERPGAGLDGPAADHPSERLARTMVHPDYVLHNAGNLVDLDAAVIRLIAEMEAPL